MLSSLCSRLNTSRSFYHSLCNSPGCHHSCHFSLGSKHKLFSWHSRLSHSGLNLSWPPHLLLHLTSLSWHRHPTPANHSFMCSPCSFILSFICLSWSFRPELPFTLLVPGKLDLIFQDRAEVPPLLWSFPGCFSLLQAELTALSSPPLCYLVQWWSGSLHEINDPLNLG